MESENATSSSPAQLTPAPAVQPLAAWFARLGVSGKILGIAAVVGIIGTFLPAMTVDAPAFKGLGKTGASLGINSPMVLDDWRGKLGILGFVTALVFVFVLYPPRGLVQKSLCWVAVGVGALVSVLQLWLLIAAINAGDLSVLGIKVSPGVGVFVTLLAAVAVTVGAFLKVREEKLV